MSFKVKKGATVKAASGKMGMGADYSLRDLKRVGP